MSRQVKTIPLALRSTIIGQTGLLLLDGNFDIAKWKVALQIVQHDTDSTLFNASLGFACDKDSTQSQSVEYLSQTQRLIVGTMVEKMCKDVNPDHVYERTTQLFGVCGKSRACVGRDVVVS